VGAPLPDARSWRGASARILLFVTLFVPLAWLLASAAAFLSVPEGRPAVFAFGVIAGAAAIAAGALLLRWADGRSVGSLGVAWTPRTPRHVMAGLGIGAAGIATAALLLVLTGALRWEAAPGDAASFAADAAASLAALAPPAFAEEAVFRGYPFQALVAWIGAAPATLLSSGLFALVHARNPNVSTPGLVNIFLAGVLLAVALLRTRSLWFVGALHLAWNWTMAVLVALPVSGLDMFAPPLYRARIDGPQWWTGGAFGPEGGLAGTIGIMVALALVLRTPRLEPDDEMRALRPLMDEGEEGV
jgi:uncharacterized protein